MNATYTPTRQSGNPLPALGLALAATVAFFAILPLMHEITEGLRPPPGVVPPAPRDIQPDPVVDPPKPPPEKKVVKDIELIEPTPPIPFELLPWALNPQGLGDGPGFDVSQFIKDIAAPEKIVEWADADVKPSVLVEVKPLTPPGMRHARAEVVVEFIIDPRGRPQQIRTVRSTHREFEGPAEDAVRRSKWQPGELNGELVATRVRLPVHFNP